MLILALTVPHFLLRTHLASICILQLQTALGTCMLQTVPRPIPCNLKMRLLFSEFQFLRFEGSAWNKEGVFGWFESICFLKNGYGDLRKKLDWNVLSRAWIPLKPWFPNLQAVDICDVKIRACALVSVLIWAEGWGLEGRKSWTERSSSAIVWKWRLALERWSDQCVWD